MSHMIRALVLAWFAIGAARASGPSVPPVPRGYTIPLLDLAGQKQRQVVVDREKGQYLGHPTTVLLEDGRTILAVYPKGHGRGAIVLKRSTDGGLTWSDRLPVPANWATSRETPTIHRVVDAQGQRRLILFSGLYPIREAVSEDDGQTWTPLEPIGGFGGIVAMSSVERLRNGDYLALFHDDGRYIRGEGHATRFRVYRTLSRDGGLSWSQPEVIAEHPEAHLCEPGLIRSPDGRQLAVLLRENSRRFNSFVIFSDDEGRTWTEPRELPGALTGDRHAGRYAPDGRLFISFRDTTHESPTKGDWVGWVGTYDDIAAGREGQYRVRLMDNHKAADCAYPGVEALPDGTFVATTYGHWTEGEAPYIVSVRFTLEELDALAKAQARPATGPEPDRTRLVVLTDISSLTAGAAEPDDGQSMIRLMLYTNEFDIEGLIASSNLGHGQRVRPELIRQVVDAYERVRPNLLLHDPRYPPAGTLRAGIQAGQPIAGLELPVEQSIGEGKDTEASAWLIAVVDRPDPRPVWVVIWGGSADLAQALWRVRKERTPEEVKRFVSKLRVHAIGDQDSTGPWIREQFPDLYAITQRRAYRGMYRGGDVSLSSSAWVREHIHGHGPLGGLYPDYNGGDIWSARLGAVRGIKEGDTPSFLALVPNGLFDPDRPWLGSWGGRFQGEGNQLADVPDTDLDTRGDPDPRMSSVYRWRPAFQADFAARLDWCVQPHAEANHPPAVRIRGDRLREARPGQGLDLDAGDTTDPDGDALEFAWSVYPAPVEGPSRVVIEGQDRPRARVLIAPELAGQTVPILLSVSDGGKPRLTRYGRVLVRVGPAESRRSWPRGGPGAGKGGRREAGFR
jgi:hypothetical protein